ncbi:hypothetical protein [uncultured Roseobacter sp.]|uniref:hypothetical protein n=1 Tax=uncultured Roseobacter sp. TaxID=114847 RepID=UPI0026273733|nr:hypothetical protein [uncultured Roseobacter sp.]
MTHSRTPRHAAARVYPRSLAPRPVVACCPRECLCCAADGQLPTDVSLEHLFDREGLR